MLKRKAEFYLLGILFFAAVLFFTAGQTLLESFLVVDSHVKKADALVLMAGSASLRLPAVVQLYEKGVAPKILLANDGNKGAWSSKYKTNLYLVEWAREYLLKKNVPEEAIELLNFSERGSYYDALNTRAYVSANNNTNTLLVITSDYHTRRTLWTFNRVFADLDIQIGVYPIPIIRDYHILHLKTLTVEFLKLLYYLIRYGLLIPSD